MLRFRLRLELGPDSHSEAARALRAVVGPVRAEPGCSATWTDEHREEGGYRLSYVEEWNRREDFVRHLRRPTFRTVLAVMELAASAPVVEIDDVASRRGFDLIEELLALGDPDAAAGGGNARSNEEGRCT